MSMALRRPLLLLLKGRAGLNSNRSTRSICPFCTHSLRIAPSTRTKPVRREGSRRHQSTIPSPQQRDRSELAEILKELRQQSPAHLDTKRWDLALEALRQTPGEERVRIAIWGLQDGEGVKDTAMRVLKSILADPLQNLQPWETELDDQDVAQPLLIRVGPSTEVTGTLTIATNEPGRFHISAPDYDNLNLEFLCMPVQPIQKDGQMRLATLASESKQPVVATSFFPVHKALLVADGLAGIVNAAAVSVPGDALRAVNMPGAPIDQSAGSLRIVDAERAERGIAVFRQGPQNAMEFERLWSSSGLPAVIDWIKSDTRPTEDGSVKSTVRAYIAALLDDIKTSLDKREQPASLSSSAGLENIGHGLSVWSQRAHAELQDELDKAFTERRWRKLGWWKLFWRVDDVSMLTNDLLTQRFLPTSERELVYFTGRIAQTYELSGLSPYPQPTSTKVITSDQHDPAAEASKWPTHISFTRRYLQEETIPALQALAQRLVAQSLGTSGIATSLAALLYVSSMVTTIYEAAAVAALGIIYSLGRMQKKWERARGFWEGEVREEGRKAVKGAGQSVSDAVATRDAPALRHGEVKELLARSIEVLGRLK